MASSVSLRAVVAIPARNEQDRIGPCLDALREQTGLAPGSFGILFLLNNCTDDTAAVVRDAARSPALLRVIEVEHDGATAGWARRVAMDAAADWLDEAGESDGLLLTSDADSRVSHDWVRKNLDAVAAGADAVAGRIILDADEAALLPPALHRRGRLEGIYERLLTEIGARLTPEPHNPWPCHWGTSGATIALRLPVYRRIGGVPAMACGEDRALIEAVVAHGYRVRHAPDIAVVTSGRLDGRAEGGVADTIRLRCAIPQTPCDNRLERLDRFLARCLATRRRPAKTVPAAAYRPLRPSALPVNIALARILVTGLRGISRLRAERRAGRPLIVSDATPASLLTPPR